MSDVQGEGLQVFLSHPDLPIHPAFEISFAQVPTCTIITFIGLKTLHVRLHHLLAQTYYPSGKM